MSKLVNCDACGADIYEGLAHRSTFSDGKVRVLCGFCQREKFGLMPKAKKMNQPTPAMQVVASYGGFSGHYLNFQEGRIGLVDLLLQLADFMEELQQITPHLNKNTWPEEKK